MIGNVRACISSFFFRINLQWIYQLSYNHSHFQSSRATSNLFYIVTSLKSGIHRFKWMTRDQNELGNARISGLYFMLMLILRFYEASSSQSSPMHSRLSGLYAQTKIHTNTVLFLRLELKFAVSTFQTKHINLIA